MSALGPHAAYIVAAYLVTAVVFAALVAWVVLDARTQKRRLAALERQGIRRRRTTGRTR